MRRTIALLVCVVLAAPGCASTRRWDARVVSSPPPQSAGRVDPALMAEYIRQVPVGSRVKITQADGKTVRGTLMKRDADPIIIQRRTRLPEAPMEIPVREILALEPDLESSAARTIGIGIAAGAGAALGVMLLLAAIFAGD